jgi:tRNA pseudouridine55 synthase
MLDRVGARFAGQTWQVPPMYSAIKRGGVPLYRLARQGIEVEREPRPIEVRALTLSPAGPATVAFRVECSKGTYVRVLAADIGQALGCGAHLLSLRRERFGKFDIGSAHTLATLEELRGADLPVVPIRAALGCLREFVISAAAAAALRRGQQMVLSQLPPATVAAEHAKIVSGDGDLIAIATADERLGGWRLVRTLAPSAGEDPPPGGAKLYKRQPVC